jgi:hypothetical protein
MYEAYNMKHKKRITEKLLEEFIKDEKKGAKTYKKYGYKSQAKDERKHAKYFKKKYKKMEKKEKK